MNSDVSGLLIHKDIKMTPNFKKISALALVLGSSSVMAGTMGTIQTQSPYNGFYIGGILGGTSTNFDFKVSEANAVIFQRSNTVGAFVGGGFVGWNTSLTDRFSAGVEVGGQYNQTNLSKVRTSVTTNLQVTDTFKLDSNVSVDLVPAWQINNDWSLIGRVGYGYGRLTWNEVFTNTGVARYPSETFTLNGLRFGLGLEHPVTNHVTVGVEYIGTDYFNPNITEAPSALNYAFNPWQNQGDVHVRYYFD